MSKRQLDATGDRDTLILGGGCAGLLVVGVGGVWTCLHLSAWFLDQPAPRRDPLRLVVDLTAGRVQWTTGATVVAAVLAVLLLALVVTAVILWPGGKKMRPDRSTRYMARADDLRHLSAVGSAAKGATFGTQSAGLPIGNTVRGGRGLFSSWEDMLILVAGPRTQKTTAYAIPCVLAAPGACLATSNKRDVVDGTAALRTEVGEVWVFDPQNVANTTSTSRRPTWWWNPLSYVTDETKAEKLAGQLVTSARTPGARTDAYFDGEAENLIGLLLLAAASGGHVITKVYSWLTAPENEEPARILAADDYPLQYESLYALSRLPDKQREGVYGTARSLMGWLRNRQITAWITPAASRRQFIPAHFAASTDTLYPLSREGEGSVGPLVAALTLAVLEALEERATASPRGRLPVPFVGVLDEAANICRMRNLDSQYSHYGSRGIVLFTLLQNWHQGAEVWGDHGIEKLWSAANVKIYGGGVDDDRFLRRLSDLIGTAERITRSASVGSGKRTVTRSVQEHPILTPAELRELPQGRAVVFASGTPAVLVEPQPWFRGPQREAITAAIEAAAIEAAS